MSQNQTPNNLDSASFNRDPSSEISNTEQSNAQGEVSKRAVAKIREQLLEQIDDDTIQIPTLPEIALSIRDICSNDNATIKDVSKVIEKDPGIAARVIKVANSPLFRGSQAIDNLSMATSRLGMRYTANYVTGVAMQQIYQPQHRVIETFMHDVWERSAMIAASATVVASQDSRFSREQSTLAGLTHLIGMLPLLLFAEKDEELRADLDLLTTAMHRIHGELGSMILYQWDFPPEIAEVPILYNDPDRDCKDACYADIISVAYCHCVDADQLTTPWLAPNQITGAHHRLNIQEFDDESEQQTLVEHIELTAAAFAA